MNQMQTYIKFWTYFSQSKKKYFFLILFFYHRRKIIKFQIKFECND